MSRNINNHCSRRNCNKHYYNNANNSCNTQLSCNDSCNTNLLSNLFSNAKKNNKLKWNNVFNGNDPHWTDGTRSDQMVIQVYNLLDEHFRNSSLNNLESFKYGENHFLCLAALEENIRDGISRIELDVMNPKRLFLLNTGRIKDIYGFMNIVNPCEYNNIGKNDDKIKNIWDSLPIDIRDAVNCLYKQNNIPSYKVKTFYNINGEKLPEAKTIYLKHYFTLINKHTAELFQHNGYGGDLNIGNDIIKIYAGPDWAAVDQLEEGSGVVEDQTQLMVAEAVRTAPDQRGYNQLVNRGGGEYNPLIADEIFEYILKEREMEAENQVEHNKILELWTTLLQELAGTRKLINNDLEKCPAATEKCGTEIAAFTTADKALGEEKDANIKLFKEYKTMYKKFRDEVGKWGDEVEEDEANQLATEQAEANEASKWEKVQQAYKAAGENKATLAALVTAMTISTAASQNMDVESTLNWLDYAEEFGLERAFLGFILWGDNYDPTSTGLDAVAWKGKCCTNTDLKEDCPESDRYQDVTEYRTGFKVGEKATLDEPSATTDEIKNKIKDLGGGDRLRTLTSRLCDKDGNKYGLLGFLYTNLDKDASRGNPDQKDLFIKKEYSINDILHLMTQPAPQETAKDYQLMPFDYLTKWGGGKDADDGWSYDNENDDLEPNGDIKYKEWKGKYSSLDLNDRSGWDYWERANPASLVSTLTLDIAAPGQRNSQELTDWEEKYEIRWRGDYAAQILIDTPEAMSKFEEKFKDDIAKALTDKSGSQEVYGTDFDAKRISILNISVFKPNFSTQITDTGQVPIYSFGGMNIEFEVNESSEQNAANFTVDQFPTIKEITLNKINDETIITDIIGSNNKTSLSPVKKFDGILSLAEYTEPTTRGSKVLSDNARNNQRLLHGRKIDNDKIKQAWYDNKWHADGEFEEQGEEGWTPGEDLPDDLGGWKNAADKWAKAEVDKITGDDRKNAKRVELGLEVPAQGEGEDGIERVEANVRKQVIKYRLYVRDSITAWRKIIDNNKKYRVEEVKDRNRRKLGGGVGLRIDGFEGINGKGGYVGDRNSMSTSPGMLVRYNGTLKRDKRPSKNLVSLYNCGAGNLPTDFIDYWNREEYQGWWWKYKFEQLYEYIYGKEDDDRPRWCNYRYTDNDTKITFVNEMYDFAESMKIDLNSNGGNALPSLDGNSDEALLAWYNFLWRGDESKSGLFHAIRPKESGKLVVNAYSIEELTTDRPELSAQDADKAKDLQVLLENKFKQLIPRSDLSDNNLEYGGAIGNIDIVKLSAAKTTILNKTKDDKISAADGGHAVLGKYYMSADANPSISSMTEKMKLRADKTNFSEENLDYWAPDRMDNDPIDWHDYFEKQYYWSWGAALWFNFAINVTPNKNLLTNGRNSNGDFSTSKFSNDCISNCDRLNRTYLLLILENAAEECLTEYDNLRTAGPNSTSHYQHTWFQQWWNLEKGDNQGNSLNTLRNNCIIICNNDGLPSRTKADDSSDLDTNYTNLDIKARDKNPLGPWPSLQQWKDEWGSLPDNPAERIDLRDRFIKPYKVHDDERARDYGIKENCQDPGDSDYPCTDKWNTMIDRDWKQYLMTISENENLNLVPKESKKGGEGSVWHKDWIFQWQDRDSHGKWIGNSFTAHNFTGDNRENLVVKVDGENKTVTLNINCDTVRNCADNFPHIEGAMVSVSDDGTNLVITSNSFGTTSRIAIINSSGENVLRLFGTGDAGGYGSAQDGTGTDQNHLRVDNQLSRETGILSSHIKNNNEYKIGGRIPVTSSDEISKLILGSGDNRWIPGYGDADNEVNIINEDAMHIPPQELNGGGLKAQGDPLVGVDIWGQSGLYEDRDQRNKRKRQFLFTDLYYMYWIMTNPAEDNADHFNSPLTQPDVINGIVPENMTMPGSLSRIDLIKKFKESLSFLNSGRLLNLCIDYGIKWDPTEDIDETTKGDIYPQLLATIDSDALTSDALTTLTPPTGGVLDYCNLKNNNIGHAVAPPVSVGTDDIDETIKVEVQNEMKSNFKSNDDFTGITAVSLTQGIGAGYGHGHEFIDQIIRSKILNKTIWNENYISPGYFTKTLLGDDDRVINIRGFKNGEDKGESETDNFGNNVMNMQDIVKRDSIVPPIEPPVQYPGESTQDQIEYDKMGERIEKQVNYQLIEDTSKRTTYGKYVNNDITLSEAQDWFIAQSTKAKIKKNRDESAVGQNKTQPEDLMYYQNIQFDDMRASVRPVRYKKKQIGDSRDDDDEYVIQAVYIEETKYNTGQTLAEGGPNGCGEYRFLDCTYDKDDLRFGIARVNAGGGQGGARSEWPSGFDGSSDEAAAARDAVRYNNFKDRYTQIYKGQIAALTSGADRNWPMNFGTSLFMNVDSNTAVITAGEDGVSEYEFNDLKKTDPLLHYTGSSFDYWVNLYDQNVIDLLGPNHPGQGVFYTGWTGYGTAGTAPDVVPPSETTDPNDTSRLIGKFKGQTDDNDQCPQETENDGWVPFYPIDPTNTDYVRVDWESEQECAIYKMIRRKYEPYITRYDHRVVEPDVIDPSIYAERHRIQAIATDWDSSREWVKDIVYNAALIGCDIDKSLIDSTLDEGDGIGDNGYKNMLFSSVSGPDEANTPYPSIKYGGGGGAGTTEDSNDAKNLLDQSYALVFGDAAAAAASGLDIFTDNSKTVVSPDKKKVAIDSVLSDYVGPLVCHKLFSAGADNHNALKTWIPSPNGYIVRLGGDEDDQPDKGPGYDKSEWDTSLDDKDDGIWPYWPEGEQGNTGEWKEQNLNINKPMDWRGLYERYLRTCSNEEVCYANWGAGRLTSLVDLAVGPGLATALALYYGTKLIAQRARRKSNETKHAEFTAARQAGTQVTEAKRLFQAWIDDTETVSQSMVGTSEAAVAALECLNTPCPKEPKGEGEETTAEEDAAKKEAETAGKDAGKDALEDIGEDLAELALEEEDVADDAAIASLACGPECGAVVGAVGTVAVFAVGIGSVIDDAWSYFSP